MGMAASQARYLGLSARKTNDEYEGQQINQARTALANQSANTFNELLALQVPTSPSTQDYTQVQYSYQDGLNGETIDSLSQIQNDPDGYNYMVTHYHFADIYTAIQQKLTNPQVSIADTSNTNKVSRGDITFDGTNYFKNIDGTPTQYQAYTPAQADDWTKLKTDYPALSNVADSDVFWLTDNDGLTHFTTKANLTGTGDANEYYVAKDVPAYIGNRKVSLYDPTDSTQKAAYDQILQDFPDTTFAGNKPIYTWTGVDGRQYFACDKDLRDAAASGPDPQHPSENQAKLNTYYAEPTKTKVESTDKAFIDIDGSGRFTSIRYEDSSAVYPLNTETITDEQAYNDAMNKYNYDTAVYQKKIQDINAKTQKIQEQDRTLELRLKQLDTERDALQTEMDSVKKVIDKNIEETFKTFQ